MSDELNVLCDTQAPSVAAASRRGRGVLCLRRLEGPVLYGGDGRRLMGGDEPHGCVAQGAKGVSVLTRGQGARAAGAQGV